MKRVLLALALFGLSLIAALILTATDSTKSVSYTPAVAHRWVEINPNKPNEIRREHVRDENGRHTIDVTYENGNRAKFIYRSTGKLEFESVVRSDALEIKHVNYADDGASVVSGFELRVDGSTIWSAQPLSDDVTVTTAFWADGTTVFGRNTHDRKTGKLEIVEHDIRGIKLLLSDSDAKTRAVTRQVEYFADGKVFRERITSKDEKKRSIQDVYVYRQDGTLEARQTWRNHTYCDEGGCGEMLIYDRTELMSRDGKTVETAVEISVSTLLPTRVTQYLPDGTKVHRELKFDADLEYGAMRVYKTVVKDASENTVSVVEDQTSGEVFLLEERFRSNGKFQTNLLKTWKALEQSVTASQP